ncbi:YheC/YheD family endospore coat-associated protein [Metabacillus malikii]|uniref:YheC/YheD family protein n=1 Tax=Metabacillus malikii TaxID=1504265 RepID=A0ABT9ZJ84_9BACI|nr:YheC/YheD family protein [Metabacillus malikii]MDQ0232334.1 hypothetical protein [Metabacillus malikii]
MSEIFTIKASNNTQYIQLPLALRRYGMVDTISFGTVFLPCKVQFKEITTHTIIIPESLCRQLKIPTKGNIRIEIHQNILYLGPLVGIFTAGFTSTLQRPLGERSLFFAKYLSTDKSIGVCSFVFGAPHINWDEGTINGYVYEEDGWKQRTFPFPNVVYDRLPNRRVENHQALKLVKSRLISEYSIPWYNPGFFNKWDIHQLLINDRRASTYLPETYLNPTITKIEEMLSTYQSIYLKPANGSLGLGVYQLMYSKEDNVYYSRYRDHNKDINRLRKFPSLEHFLKVAFKDNRLSHYLAQQGIKLIRLDNKPIDFRVHTNKNKDGIWSVTAVAAKVAGKGSATTHLNNGGVVRTLEELFENQFERQKAYHRLSDAALLLSHSIDKYMVGYIGELGFDLGLDQSGDVWMFEANSKPGRSIFSHPKLKDADILSRKSSLEYSIYLFKKSIYYPEEFQYGKQ